MIDLEEKISREDYCNSVGDLGETLVREILQKLLHEEPEPHDWNREGPDASFMLSDLGVSVWNWYEKSYCDVQRGERVVEDLKPYKHRIQIILCPVKPKHPRKLFENNGVWIVHIPLQIITRNIWLQLSKSEREGRRLLSDKIIEKITKVLKRVLKLLGVLKRVAIYAEQKIFYAKTNISYRKQEVSKGPEDYSALCNQIISKFELKHPQIRAYLGSLRPSQGLSTQEIDDMLFLAMQDNDLNLFEIDSALSAYEENQDVIWDE